MQRTVEIDILRGFPDKSIMREHNMTYGQVRRLKAYMRQRDLYLSPMEKSLKMIKGIEDELMKAIDDYHKAQEPGLKRFFNKKSRMLQMEYAKSCA